MRNLLFFTCEGSQQTRGGSAGKSLCQRLLDACRSFDVRRVRAKDWSDVGGEGPKILLWSRKFLLGQAIFISATKSITLTSSARLRKLNALGNEAKATTK
jgi:hypothetical protein